MTTVNKINDEQQLLLSVQDKMRRMLLEYQNILNDSSDKTLDFTGKIIRRLIRRDPTAMCEGHYLSVVNQLMQEYQNKASSENFDFFDWLNRYVSALPDNPLEALSYDRFIVAQYNRQLMQAQRVH